MSETTIADAKSGSIVFGGRIFVGLLQGLALYLLYLAFDDKTWPATNGYLFAPLVLVALFLPLALIQALGNVRRWTLIIWLVLAAALLAGFAWYDIWHGWPTERVWDTATRGTIDGPRLLPAFITFFFAAVLLFIGQALVAAGDGDRKFIAQYKSHFDVAWKQGLHLALAAVFVGIFWALLFLGAEMFKLIKLDFLDKLIEHRWFAIPATTLAIATAIHITDVRSILVRGARTLVLALLSWLLPLIALIASGFLVSLFFTGLQPLWDTKFGTSLLLASSAWLVILINAAYQDGDTERRPVAVLRWAVRVSGVMLAPLVALAGYALYLRVAQYGWTADRISAAACIVVAAAYAVGYAIAALWPKDWFKPVERWNFWTAILVLAVIGALFSPLADPARISVASQVARLESGKIAADKFDFYYLHRDGGRFGKVALEKLAKSTNEGTAAQARLALVNTYSPYPRKPAQPATPRDLGNIFTVLPAGKHLPQNFLKQDWLATDGVNSIRECFDRADAGAWSCRAVIKDLDGDGSDEITLLQTSAKKDSSWLYVVTLKEKAGTWVATGKVAVTDGSCKGASEAMLAGNFNTVPPEQPDLQAGGHRIVLEPIDRNEPCK